MPRLTSVTVLLAATLPLCAEQLCALDLSIRWEDRMLRVSGEGVPGGEVRIWYLEAYCRPSSTERAWDETVIGHKTELIRASDDGKTIQLKDTLRDGVIVEHEIKARGDTVDFHLTAHNPSERESEAHWAQPCIRVDKFTGAGKNDALALVPKYAHKCFIFLDDQLTRLPTEPWAVTARYIPGQVYGAPGVDRNDLNPRPLSVLTPSIGLCGCFSADEKMILAVAWQPYQEIFQGVIACLHSDFRIGGLKPGETKKIRGRLYIVPADVDVLLERFREDFTGERDAPAPQTAPSS
jgi:hypothetical protein